MTSGRATDPAALEHPAEGEQVKRALGAGGDGLLFLLLGGFPVVIGEPGATGGRYDLPVRALGWVGVVLGAVLALVGGVRHLKRR